MMPRERSNWRKFGLGQSTYKHENADLSTPVFCKLKVWMVKYGMNVFESKPIDRSIFAHSHPSKPDLRWAFNMSSRECLASLSATPNMAHIGW